jgi:beta-glucanase (GH16 family)
VNAGGVPGTGGAKAIGGTNSTGGSLSTGGANSTGGTATSGGAGATGGTASTTGGTASTGGSKAAGGASNIGGNTSTGGTKPTGGTASTGGSKPAGGATSTGGSKSTGGTVATGGSNSTGGATGTGGGSGTDMCGRTTTITVPSGYTKLAWHDEFDVSGTPNSANWGYETGFVRNNELQWYQSQNASVSGGLLTITGKREQVTNPNYNPNGSDWKTTRQYAQYTSASMTTSGKQSWKFGRFEMCGKIPISAGMWPAWWTLGVSGEWPSNGEIDIMEYYNGKILANIAWATSTRWTAHWDSSTKAVDAAWAAQYHLWRMDWDSTKIDLYVDDTLMNTGNLSAMLNDTNGQSPFLQNAYMIVNLAIGGDNGGDPSGTTFPQQYLIDYIRVFQ